MAESPTTPAHLPPSALGTKEYWDKLYETELSNHAHNPADQGTVWFDDSDAEAKVVAFLDEHAQADYGIDPATAAVLDLGCGNGSLLFALGDEGWNGDLVGVDYSERSVKLAREVGRTRREEKGDEEEDGGKEVVEFRVWDVLRGDVADLTPTSKTTTTTTGEGAGWDVVLDKGTFDAVSLSAEQDAQGRRICEGYGERVVQLLRPGGIFVVTSCNWTEKELVDWFEAKTVGPAGERLRLAGRIEYPSFSFGGVKGQTISTLCFEKAVA